ncbi:hypothetical protein [Bacillus sp. SG-1]|uniref:hypothetical protein n=1 Tax=Bacillus sp. SG-1 TaxID=161544 RepID=UPI0001543762|nr:hypothetical protein [Bacillus sp. SG-1]EDL65987.1 hypothetical protein BSG1_01505 [Bacillus sp. SG-1]
MPELSELDFHGLDELSIDDKKNLLQEEYDMYQVNSSIRYEFDNLNEDAMNEFLESVFNAKAVMEVTQGGEYPAKLVASINDHSNLEEEEFFHLLRVLYLNDYIEYFKDKEFDLSEESKDVIYEDANAVDTTFKTRYNLHRLFRNDKELFNEEYFSGHESINSEERMYYKFLNYGTIIDQICSYGTLIRLSNKGMHYLHFVTNKRSVDLMHKHEKTLKEINTAKEEQANLLGTFHEHKAEQESSIGVIKDLINKHSNKIKDFYKDITTILSLMLAAFALIGVNISAIPKIESNFTANLLAMNLSLILCMLVLFYILRVIVYDSQINSKHFYLILGITISGIVGVFIFLGFNHESKIEVIEKKYQNMLEKNTQDNQQDILELKKQIEELENQVNE